MQQPVTWGHSAAARPAAKSSLWRERQTPKGRTRGTGLGKPFPLGISKPRDQSKLSGGKSPTLPSPIPPCTPFTQGVIKPPQKFSSSSWTGRRLIQQAAGSLLQVSQAKPVQYQTRLAPAPAHRRETSCLSREKDSLEVLGKVTDVQIFSNRRKRNKQTNRPTQLSYSPLPSQSSSTMLMFSNKFP